MIAVVTDSTSQLTSAQAAAAGIRIVPILIRIEDDEFHEGVDLDAETFYSSLGDGVRLSTSAPSPGAVLDVYRALIEQGATEIVSVHVADTASGTLNAARIAAAEVAVPVHLIDSKMTSYGLGVVALELADRVARTGSTDGIDRFAEALVAGIGTVFILQDLDYVLRGGRMRRPELPSGAADIPVLGGFGGAYDLVTTGRTIDALVDAMVAFLLEGEHRRHVAVAHAAPDTLDFTLGLERQLGESDKVASLHRYRMGPSIAVYTGPGTAGGFSWPAE